MKILHIAFSGLGGHGNVFFSLVDADKEKKHEYAVIFFGIDEIREEYIEKATARNLPWYFVKKKPGFDFGSYNQIETIIKESLPDIVFIHAGAYIFPVKKAQLSMAKKIKIIVRETQPNHLKTKLEWLGLCVCLVVATRVVFLSTEYRDHIRKKLRLLFSDKRTAVIPNGIDLEFFKPAAKTVEPFIKIGMQSRLSDTKDHQTLINAFALLLKSPALKKPAVLYIAGDGSCALALQKQVARLELIDAVIFTGMLKETALPGFINSLDIYVHATLGETMSTAIMQVMGCGIPVIGSDVQGVDNMLSHNKTGLLVPAKDAEKLCAAMLQLVNDTGFAQKLAHNAFEFAHDHYSNRLMLDRYNLIFNT